MRTRRAIEILGILTGVTVAALYAYFTSLRFVGSAWGRDPELVATVIAAVTVVLCVHRWLRFAVRLLTFGHAIVGFMMVQILARGSRSFDPIDHLLFNALLPAVAGLLIVSDWRPTGPEPPPGYEHLGTLQRSIGLEKKLLIGVVVGLLGTLSLGFNLVVVAILVPATVLLWSLYAIAGVVRNERHGGEAVARRMRVAHGQDKPSQKHTFWTFNSADFNERDPE